MPYQDVQIGDYTNSVSVSNWQAGLYYMMYELDNTIYPVSSFVVSTY